MKYIDELFFIEYNNENIDKDTLNKFIACYKTELKYILKELNCTKINIPIHLFSKIELDNYVKQNSISYKSCNVPKWLVGFSSSVIVCVLEPTEDNLYNIIKVAIHESIHYILYNMYPNQDKSKLLDEGLATYYSKQNFAYNLKQIQQDYNESSLKTISDLSTQDSIKFANINGYAYCYYVLDFLLQEYGIKKVLAWYNDKKSFELDVVKLNLDIKFNKYITKKLNE